MWHQELIFMINGDIIPRFLSVFNFFQFLRSFSILLIKFLGATSINLQNDDPIFSVFISFHYFKFKFYIFSKKGSIRTSIFYSKWHFYDHHKSEFFLWFQLFLLLDLFGNECISIFINFYCFEHCNEFFIWISSLNLLKKKKKNNDVVFELLYDGVTGKFKTKCITTSTTNGVTMSINSI